MCQFDSFKRIRSDGAEESIPIWNRQNTDEEIN